MQAYYGYNQKLVRECEKAALFHKLHSSANDVVKSLRETIDMLTEWVHLFSSKYYSFSRKTDIYKHSIIDRLTVDLEHATEADENTVSDIPWKKRADSKKAKEIPPIYIEPPLSAVFPNRPTLKIPAASFFRSSVNLLTRRTWSADCLSA